MTLKLKDFETVKTSTFKTFKEKVASITKEDCWDFDLAVSCLESQLTQLYSFAALMAKRETGLKETAQIWDEMIFACDEAAKLIQKMSKKHTTCSGPHSHDRILDIRNRCARLKELHS